MTIIHHLPCLPNVLTSFFQTVIHGINPSLPRSTYQGLPVHSPTYPILTILSFPILSICQNYQRTLSSLLSSTPFVPLHKFLICTFGTLFILLILNRPLILSICICKGHSRNQSTSFAVDLLSHYPYILSHTTF